MHQPFVTAEPYRVGSSVSSVELLLEARTAADSVVGAVSQQLASGARVDGAVTVTGVRPGPATANGAMKFLAQGDTGVLGALVVEPITVVQLADLIIGGRGTAEDRPPSSLELDLFAARMLAPVATLIDAVAPNRPEARVLVEGDYPTPARSLVVELSVEHADTTAHLLVEVLAHHLAADPDDKDAAALEAVCEDVPLEMSFRFAPVHLHTREIAQLQPGDVICLEHEAGKPLVGEVDGRPLVIGRVGVSHRRAAVEVVDLVEGNA